MLNLYKFGCFAGNGCLRKEMGGKAIDYAKDFTWDKIADEYEGFLIETHSCPNYDIVSDGNTISRFDF